MPKEGRKIRVHDESINVYGFRVKTNGWMNRQQFEANPIMLFNHNQPWKGDKSEVLPIGYWKDLEVLGDEIHGIPVFDVEDKDFARAIAGKYKRKVLRAASIGIRIIATSDDPADMVQGQTRPTVTKWELREISIVDIPANKNAVVLYDSDNNLVNLSDSGGVLPILNPELNSGQVQKSTTIKMEKDQNLLFVAGFLGLKSGATMAEVQDGIANLRQKNNDLAAENVKLKEENKAYKDAENALQAEQSKALLDAALNDGRITNESRPMWEQNFTDNFENAKRLLALMQGKVKKLSEVPNKKGEDKAPTAMTHLGKTFKELDRDNPKALQQLKDNDFDTFKAMFKADYGVEYEEVK